jgi:hypothetical protein
MEGHYPSPSLYGAWVARERRNKEWEEARTLLRHAHSLTTNKEEVMKRTKTHSGTFHCPNCFIEVELLNEESLKCDKCKGPLAEGNLDEIWADEDDTDGE